jgi:hypothetical protein
MPHCTRAAPAPTPGADGQQISSSADSGGTNAGGSLLDPQEFAALPLALEPNLVQSDTPGVVSPGNHILSQIPPCTISARRPRAKLSRSDTIGHGAAHRRLQPSSGPPTAGALF